MTHNAFPRLVRICMFVAALVRLRAVDSIIITGPRSLERRSSGLSAILISSVTEGLWSWTVQVAAKHCPGANPVFSVMND